MPLDIENARLTLALAIPTGTPIKVANDAIEMLPLAVDKTIKHLNQKIKRSIIFTKPFTH